MIETTQEYHSYKEIKVYKVTTGSFSGHPKLTVLITAENDMDAGDKLIDCFTGVDRKFKEEGRSFIASIKLLGIGIGDRK